MVWLRRLWLIVLVVFVIIPWIIIIGPFILIYEVFFGLTIEEKKEWVLWALVDGPKTGSGIMDRIQEISNGRVKLTFIEVGDTAKLLEKEGIVICWYEYLERYKIDVKLYRLTSAQQQPINPMLKKSETLWQRFMKAWNGVPQSE